MSTTHCFPPAGPLRDLEQADRRREIRFLAEWLDGNRGPVLLAGAGTGRTALPLLEKSPGLTALEHDSALLSHFAEKAKARLSDGSIRRLTLQHGNLLTIQGNERFARIILSDGHLMDYVEPSAAEKALTAVARLLKPRGRGLFSVFQPDPARLAVPALWHHRQTVEFRGQQISRSDRISWDGSRQVLRQEIRRRLQTDAGSQEQLSVRELRVFFPAELPLLLARAGLRILEIHGDWDGRPFGPGTARQIIHFRRERGVR